MTENERSDSYPVIPETNEYSILSFLVRDCGDRFSSDEIMSAVDNNETVTTDTIESLAKNQSIEWSEDTYFVESERGQYLRHRVESIEAAKHPHDTAPNDDVYSREDWESELGSLDSL